MKEKAKLIPLTVRLNPTTHVKLWNAIRKHPHMTLNVLINEILEKKLTGAEE